MTRTTRFTDEQAAAVGARGTSVALGAGAGCGKTFVLTERFVADLVPDAGGRAPARLHELVAITFTEAAAREMRDRIRRRCYEQLQTSREHADRWLRLLRELEAARISTIHSFCGNLLRTYAAEADVDPDFGTLEQADADVLLQQSLDDVLRRELARHHEPTLDLVSVCNLASVKAQVRALLAGWRAGLADDWLDATPDALLERWQRFYDDPLFPSLVLTLSELDELPTMLTTLEGIHPSSGAFQTKRENLLELLPKLAQRNVTCDDLSEIVVNCNLTGVSASKCWPSKDDYQRYKNATSALREAIQKLPPRPGGVASREVARLSLEALRLAGRVAARYEETKAEQGQLDFQDLLARTHRLLTETDLGHVRDEVAANLQLVLVDEFQDTDALQVEIVEALCGGDLQSGKLFFVGDHKQSIYRFRGAEPVVFHQLQQQVVDTGRLALTLNFRSQPGILHFVNQLFGEDLADYQPLRAHRGSAADRPVVEFLWAEVPKELAAAERRLHEARRLARRLRYLLESGDPLIPDESAAQIPLRTVQAGDIAILFRALGDVRYYEQALREYGLEYYLVGGHAFYAQQEIFDVLNLLRSVATSCDEISLAGALRSPFFALADETLFWMYEEAESLNEAVRRRVIPAALSAGERAKLEAAAETLSQLRKAKDRLPIAGLIRMALARTGYDATILAEFMGERKLANLHKLIEQARAVDQGQVLGLGGFIAQLAEFVAQQPKEPPAATCPESANVIRLMSIHQSKGQEFPVVVVPDLERKYSWTSPAAKLHPELGPLIKTPADFPDATAGMELFRFADEPEELEERKRILYVACTRAADYLILSSSVDELDNPKSDWMRLMARRFDLRSGATRQVENPDLVTVTTGDMLCKVERQLGPRRRDLRKAVETAAELARSGRGLIPQEIAARPADVNAPHQFSVTRLSGQLVLAEGDDEEEDEDDPVSAEERATRTSMDGVDPRALGNLVHAVLEQVHFGQELPPADWCRELAYSHAPDDPDRLAKGAAEMVGRFLASPRARQLSAAPALYRELEFLLVWPPGETALGNHTIRGFIDCFYQDDHGAWHLLDFKTSAIAAGEAAQASKRYTLQMGVYALAVERALTKTPAEVVLHYLHTGEEHFMRWDEENRERTIDSVNRAIEEVVAAMGTSQQNVDASYS